MSREMADRYDPTHENHLREVERALLYISQARVKAEQIADDLAKKGAEERFVTALRTAAAAMSAEHKRLMQATYWTVPDDQQAMRVEQEPPEQERMAV